MLKQSLKKSFMLLLATVVIFSFGTVLNKDKVTAATSTVMNIGTNATAQVKSADLITQDKGLYLIYTLTIKNNSNSKLQLDDYWSKVSSVSGVPFKTSPIAAEKSITSLNGKSSIDLTYYAQITSNLTLSKLQINMYKFDVTAPELTRQLGKFPLSAQSSSITAAFLPKYLVTNESKLKTAVKSAKSTVVGEVRTLTVSFLIENLNAKDYNASKTQYYVMTSDGSLYTAKNDTLKDLNILPKERKIFDLEVNIPAHVDISNSKLISGYLSEADGIFIPSGTYALPKAATIQEISVPAFLPKYIQTTDSKIKTALKGISSSVSSSTRNVELQFLIENQGTKSYKPSTVQFFIVSGDGSYYSSKSDAHQSLVIQPKERKIFTLSFSVPSKVDFSSIKLVMGNTSGADSVFKQVASYLLPNTTVKTTTDIQSTTYNDYKIEIISYTRLPAGAKDTLTANFKVTNVSKEALAVPRYKSLWSFNGIEQSGSTSEIIAYDQRLQLEPGDSMELISTMQIPYSAVVQQARVILKDTTDSQAEKVIGQFKSEVLNKFAFTDNGIANFDRLSAKSSVQLLRVRSSVEGKQMNVSGDLVFTNLEARSALMQKYAVYLQADNGEVYPLTVAEYTKSVISNGRILMPFSGTIPVTAQSTNMNILIADLVTGTTEAGAQANVIPGHINKISKAWPNSTPNNKFNNLAIGKFDITLDKFYAYLNYGSFNTDGLNLELEYSMLSDLTFDDVAGSYKLRIEIEDQNTNKTVVFKEFALGDAEQEFKEGNNIKQTIFFSDTTLAAKAESLKEYKLSMYCVVNDQKVLLAERTLPYFYIQWLLN
ncbi:MAG: hypothetical protein P0Y55_15405 [Candidatus Cohnella colombiensis]|uniref:Uncharacterized protein n=1 Tax=Candidatus Cohnella colombiensis TaxID=3121368 RepID=A0AA95JCI0_9BACL|nr:MAG: hypothetical protein P0Y55_15405 [Cohnella sp.]